MAGPLPDAEMMLAAQGQPVEPDPLGVAMEQMLDAAVMCGKKGAGATDAREVKEFAQSALAFAQAFAVLDPDRLQGGDTPEARVDAAPPQPTSTRDTDRDGKIGEK